MPMPQPISEVVDLIATAARGDGSIRLAPQGTGYLLPLMNYTLKGHSRVERVYWAVESSKLRGITDNVRTILVELVAEMRVGMPVGAETPPHDVAQHAFNVVIHGSKRVTVTQSAAGADATVASAGSKASISNGAEPESSHRTVMWWLVGVGTLVAAVAGVWALFIG